MLPKKKSKSGSLEAGKPGAGFQAEWKKIEESFDELIGYIESGYLQIDNGHYKRSMESYSMVYNLCTKNDGAKSGVNITQMLYQRAKRLVENHLETKVTKNVVGLTGDTLLQAVHKQRDSFALVGKWVKFMFRYLDDYYTRNPQIDELSIMMLKCFQMAVFEKIKLRLREVILKGIELERDGNSVNRTFLRCAIWTFIDMGMCTCNVYTEDLEKDVIAETQKYYKREASKWMAEEGGQFTYLLKAEARINEESRRADAILAPSTKGPLLRALDEELLCNYLTTCIEDPEAGAEALLRAEKHADLGRMYRLFNRVPDGLDTIAKIVQGYIEKEGKAINQRFCTGGAGEGGEGASTTYIKACLALHDKYSDVFTNYLDNHEAFLKSRKAAYEVFVNPQQSDAWVLKQKVKDKTEVVTASELLSTYVDGVMKKEMESEEQLDLMLDKCVTLFTYIHDKDLFQQFYMKQMSRRLMHNKNERLLDQERLQISKLKMKMGSAYTSKLEGMLTDQGMADSQNKHFREYLMDLDCKLTIDFTPLVLTTGFWPAFKHDTLQPPEEMEQCLTNFGRFYDKNTQSRKLTWIHSLGHATVSRKFPKGPREMTVTTYQACILLLFNETGKLVAKDAQESTKLPFEEVKRTIHSLAYGKYPVIRRADRKALKQVKETDEFEINDDFTTGQRKFKIPAVVKQEREAIVDTNQEQRRHVIEACIVRIMKSRRAMKHTELIAETIKQLSHLFAPEPRIIKKRVEDLIQRQYLERDDQDRNQYRYLA